MTLIELDNVSLHYPIFGSRSMSLKSGILNLATGGRLVKDYKSVEVEALKEITLSLKSGDRLGLIGHNGAGKTTLLKVLAQIYLPSKGHVHISGKVHCLFDLILGMDFECSGHENILIRGKIAGLTNKEIKEITPEIVEFAELGEFIKMPIKTYSSGMLIRLAFGIMTSFRSDILLIDEIIGVGDKRFMEKAKQRIENRIRESDIMVFSTHDSNSIRTFCNKVLWLEHGQMKAFGDYEAILAQYQSHQPC